MMNKIVGYAGFRPYGELEYPTQKQGKDLQKTNQIWSATVRQCDQIKHLENFQNYKSIYRKHYLQNTLPEHYYPRHVPRGSNSTLSFPDNATGKPYDLAEAEKTGSIPRNNDNMLKTGTQHWKTNYQKDIGNHTQFNRTQGFKDNQGQGNNMKNGKEGLLTGQKSMSLGKNLNVSGTKAEETKSYKNRPQINNCKTGITDYKFNYGDRIGFNPLELLNHTSLKQTLRDHPLKYGTNQLWSEIPGYQGFKPSQRPFKELEKKIHERKFITKDITKQNLIENYHMHVPGYAGLKSKYLPNDHQLRESCFNYKK